MESPHFDPLPPFHPYPIAGSSIARHPPELVADVRDSRGRRLLAVLEPVAPSPGANAVANLALTALQRGFLLADDAPLADAVTAAFAAANRELHTENDWPAAAGRRRVLAGATVAAFAGADLIVAVTPPGQAIVIQDHILFAFPTLDTWQATYEPTDDDFAASPLGASETTLLQLHSTTIAPGDVVLIGPNAIGRALASSPNLLRLVSETPTWLPAELTRTIGNLPRGVGHGVWLTVASNPDPDLVHETAVRRPSVPLPKFEIPAEALSPRLRRAIFFDRAHQRLIEAFERLAPAAGPISLPLDAQNRAISPPGAGYIARYRGFKDEPEGKHSRR